MNKIMFAITVIATCLCAILHFQKRSVQSELRESEGALLTAKHKIVVREWSESEMKNELTRHVAASSELASQVEELKGVVKNFKPVTITKVRTKEIEVIRPPTLSPDASDCALKYNDKATVEAVVVEAKTDAGNVVIIGEATVYRTSPEPKTKILSGRFDVATSSAVRVVAKEIERRSWGYGLGATTAKEIGVLMSSPSVNILGVGIEVVGSLTIGSHGATAGLFLVGRP